MSAPLDASTRCPCCAAEVEGPPAFVHDRVPVLLNVLAATEDEARNAATGRLELCECPHCGMVFNRAFASVPYGRDYFLDATRSPRYQRHLDDIADRLATRMASRPAFSVADVGAGQGLFLAHLADRLGPRLSRAYGFDPAYRDAAVRLPDVVSMTAAPIDPEHGAGVDFSVDVVVTRHVIEHMPAPAAFLSTLRAFFPRPFLLVVETPDVSHTLERGLLHDFCYEHCAMATDTALSIALQRAGYERVEIEHGFDGEYLLAFAMTAPQPTHTATIASGARREPGRLIELAQRFVPEHRTRMKRARSRGPIAIWGGAGKGALLALLLDPKRELVDCVVDIHPSKRGSFLPGAGHPVVTPEDARDRGIRTVFVANPTYTDEVAARCAALGTDIEIEPAGFATTSRPGG